MNILIKCSECPTMFISRRASQTKCKKCHTRLYDAGLLPLKSILPETFTEIQQEIFNGLMLGDGSLNKTKKETHYSNLIVVRQAQDLDYLLWQQELLKEFYAINSKPIYFAHKSKDKKDKTKFKTHYYYRLITRAGVIFSNYRKIWYPNGKKIIPPNLILTPLTIAVWLADDGSITYGRNKETLKITLCTHGFSKNDVEKIALSLSKRYNEHFRVYMEHREGYDRPYPIIHGANAATRTLLNDIDSAFPISMSRKSDIWRCEDAHFYTNIPKTRPSIQRFKMQRTAQLLDFFKGRTIFTYNDVASELNWYTHRKDEINVVQTQEIKKYIKQYITQDFIKEINRTNKGKIIFEITDAGLLFFNAY